MAMTGDSPVSLSVQRPAVRIGLTHAPASSGCSGAMDSEWQLRQPAVTTNNVDKCEDTMARHRKALRPSFGMTDFEILTHVALQNPLVK